MEYQSNISLLSLLIITAIAQSLFVIVRILITNRFVSISKNIIALILFVISLELFHDVLVDTKYIFDLPWVLRYGHIATFLIGPLLYLYIKSITTETSAFKKINYLHFLPFLYFFFINNYQAFLEPVESKLSFFN